jgi:hypothetical protein
MPHAHSDLTAPVRSAVRAARAGRRAAARPRRWREAVGSRPEWRLATSGARDFAAAIASSFVIRAYYGAGVRRGRSRVDPGLSLPGSTRLRVESIVKKVPRQGTGEEKAPGQPGQSPKEESPPRMTQRSISLVTQEPHMAAEMTRPRNATSGAGPTQGRGFPRLPIKIALACRRLACVRRADMAQ